MEDEVIWKEFGTVYRVNTLGVVQTRFRSTEWRDKKLKRSKTDKWGGFYVTFSWNGEHVRLHRHMWETFVGYIPTGHVIDHIDGDRSNNALSNLRLVTHRENYENRKALGRCRLKNQKVEVQAHE